MKIIRKTLLGIALIIIGVLLYLNIKVHTGPNLNKQEETDSDIITQLNFLEHQLKNENLGVEMQKIFPEGFVFTYALYGLTWCQIAENQNDNSPMYLRALTEARYAYNSINSDYGKSIFPTSLKPKYGAFYSGWKNYLLSKILACQVDKDTDELAEFELQCEELSKAFSKNKSPYLRSYSNSAWPADSFLGLTSLKIHDNLFVDKYQTVISNWMNKVKLRLDPETGLIPHSVNPMFGNHLEGGRGSSISLILRLLSEIDPEFAAQQFEIYAEKFQITRFGLPAIREYPKGINGMGDVDSGPVILDVGFSGTIVAIGTLKIFGETESANLLSGTIEAFGVSRVKGNQKMYAFGKLPIADAFLCWSKSAKINSEIIELKGLNTYVFGSAMKFHFYSLLVIILILSPFFGKGIIQYFKVILKKK